MLSSLMLPVCCNKDLAITTNRSVSSGNATRLKLLTPTCQASVGCGKCFYCLRGEKNLCDTPTVIGLSKQGALAEYISIPANLVYKLPDELSYDEGVLVEPLSIAVYAVRKVGMKVGDHIAVVGQGPIGLFVDFVAKASGGTVYGFDKHDNRIAYAKDHGYIHKGFNIMQDGYLKQW